jgi:hypothetical protein
MATKKKEAPKATAPAKGGKKAPAVQEPVKGKSGKKELTPEEKAAKKAARLEALKNRPEGQRPNSRQVDVIETENGKVETFAYPIRKTGSLVTSILKDAKGNAISVSSVFIPGVKAKSKKGHGMFQPGVAGEGKKKGGAEDEDEEGDED